ncbi:NAD(P)-dependent dehydrogenase (short-subunit alcohol dehydrogenase family) [Microbacterium endophyticum]|uniref:NAD(P)-dependent dehydrogenase (Short-subunit alcohol dehydrogenase family) n=1 Tax=Microbacterium endophyticum TaxID=1526412 RepID=A0A7W4V4S1_9MICO|nr:SDR family NAD(P)-dependent oxidoreductase [Microbacterium endophyticum]MBB2976843.1 NAD(P)-dependent dehydrogenase (short-subunit alcohol dehydrogenase family) [Microbacterium endophyticum]NIK35839.1 NAD(P)-dependent dehydrogenase (short-subunit alcohol dehydrogenase family) [Microbacterium endophyticum]
MNSAQAVTAVTGGSRGIGAAIVRRLAADGHDVVIGHRDDATAAGAVRGAGRLIDLDPAELKHDLEVNLLGAVLTSRATVEHLAESAGSLGLIGSAAATIDASYSPTMRR